MCYVGKGLNDSTILVDSEERDYRGSDFGACSWRINKNSQGIPVTIKVSPAGRSSLRIGIGMWKAKKGRCLFRKSE